MRTGRLADHLFAGSLRCFPREFRARHGQPMRAMFGEQWAARSGQSAMRRAVFLSLVLVDSAWSGIVQRLASLRANRSGVRGPGPVRRGRRSGSRELGQAMRALARRPAYTAMAVGTLALGIGGVASIASVAWHVLLKPLAYESGDEIVELWWNGRMVDSYLTEYFSASSAMIEHFAANNRTARAIAWVSARDDATLTTDEGSERVSTGGASPDFFSFLGIAPVLGRLDVPDDGRTAGVVLSHVEWVRRWGGDPSIIGRDIRLQNAVRPVIGILPPDFEWVERTASTGRADYWIIRDLPSIPNYYYYRVLVKPAPGLTAEDVRLDFGRSVYADVATRQEPKLPVTEAATAELLRDHTLGPLRVRVGFLLASVLFVVLLGALSVSNLLLGRLADRDHEMGVRLSLGASRADLVRLITIEVALIASAGGLIGLFLARSGLALIKGGAPMGIPRLASATISPEILAGIAVLTVIVALIVLVPPAWGTVSDSTGASILRISIRGNRRTRSRALLILSQVTLATVLLIGSTLMLRSLISLAHVDLGFDPDGIAAAAIQLPGTYWTTVQTVNDLDQPVRIMTAAPALQADLDRFRDGLSAVPGVDGVAFAEHVPLSGAYGTWMPFVPEGADAGVMTNESAAVSGNAVDDAFFDILDVSLVEGRFFRPEDRQPGARLVAVVSDRLAARYWPGQSAIGKRFEYTRNEASEDGRARHVVSMVEIVGIVAGLRERDLERAEASIYFPRVVDGRPTTRAPQRLAFFISTGLDDPASIMPALRRVVTDVFPNVPLRHFAPMRATVDDLMTGPVFYTTLLSLFAGYGLLLSLVGIIGVIHHQISRREKEVAVRMALGALPREVLGLLGRETALSAATGITIGLGIAAALTRLIESMLFDVAPLDPWTFIAIPLLFFGAAMAAAIIPGRRLTGLRPVQALRSE